MGPGAPPASDRRMEQTHRNDERKKERPGATTHGSSLVIVARRGLESICGPPCPRRTSREELHASGHMRLIREAEVRRDGGESSRRTLDFLNRAPGASTRAKSLRRHAEHASEAP